MSKQRQLSRARREAEAEARRAEERARRERAAAARARRDRRALRWRRVRLWQHGGQRRGTRERTAALTMLIAVVIVLAYLTTRSVAATVGTALIAVIALPVLIMIFFDRRR